MTQTITQFSFFPSSIFGLLRNCFIFSFEINGKDCVKELLQINKRATDSPIEENGEGLEVTCHSGEYTELNNV